MKKKLLENGQVRFHFSSVKVNGDSVEVLQSVITASKDSKPKSNEKRSGSKRSRKSKGYKRIRKGGQKKPRSGSAKNFKVSTETGPNLGSQHQFPGGIDNVALQNVRDEKFDDDVGAAGNFANPNGGESR